MDLKCGFEDMTVVDAWCGVLMGEDIELAQHLSEKHRSRDRIYRMDDKRRRRQAWVKQKWLGRGRAPYSPKYLVSYIIKDDQS